MLVRILNTLRSRIWDVLFFLFSGYSKSTVGENGEIPRFLRQNGAFGATEQNQTYKHSLFVRRLNTIPSHTTN
mgnify:CR=1 FL=1|jgi:hypothetical protein